MFKNKDGSYNLFSILLSGLLILSIITSYFYFESDIQNFVSSIEISEIDKPEIEPVGDVKLPDTVIDVIEPDIPQHTDPPATSFSEVSVSIQETIETSFALVGLLIPVLIIFGVISIYIIPNLDIYNPRDHYTSNSEMSHSFNLVSFIITFIIFAVMFMFGSYVINSILSATPRIP